ncbi:tubulin polyglutamylase TTLL13-like [Acyrthosiphon pisum]|uniref:Tubulin--tyrosine ligase-like protein 9 n=1 Tax=Acyrthosiphon pisum TaxID=7029 RepID=A0A8R2JM68_ACYPI|nr:tubulin polyglutamylase TTLL13-like [Acyrthosiphon pisum]
MSKSFRDDYNFYPKTWYLPSDYKKFKAYVNQHESAAYILKPTTGGQGTGKYITKSPEKINQYKQRICQIYISKRLATELYETPEHYNIADQFMHLTNYSINRYNKKYIDNELFGSKRRFTALNDWLRSEGYDVKKIWNEIDDIIIKTMILAYPFVNHCYQMCFSGHKYTPPCFEILGFYIILNENCKPYLMEVKFIYNIVT